MSQQLSFQIFNSAIGVSLTIRQSSLVPLSAPIGICRSSPILTVNIAQIGEMREERKLGSSTTIKILVTPNDANQTDYPIGEMGGLAPMMENIVEKPQSEIQFRTGPLANWMNL